MENKKLFQIGDVAKMFHISVGSLRHYEQVGLLKPEYTDPETGYRYYSARQFEVLNMIRYLRVLDMPLGQIGEFLGNRDIDVIEDKLLNQKKLIEKTAGVGNNRTQDIKAAYPTIGKGTVYRNLDILVDEGSLRKVEVPDGANRFDFSLKNHYHVRCTKCGEVSDVDMDEIPDLLERIHNTHGIEFLD